MGFVLVASANAWADLRADGLKSSSRILVAVVGPDWNPSSVKVREAFASPAFRRSFPKTLFGEFVVNEWTKPDEATVKGNAYTKSLVPSIHRYPTILIYDAKGRSQGRLENVPAELDGAALARRVRAQITSVETAVAKLPTSPGEGLVALQSLVPGLTYVDRRKRRQVAWYGDAWQNLLKQDPTDAKGWQLRLFMGNGLGEISRGTALVNSKDEKVIADFEARAEKLLALNLSPVQKQALLLSQFARIRHTKAAMTRQIELLKRAHALDPRSIWGWAAYRFLRDRKVTVPAKWDVISRVDYGKGVLDYQLKPWKKGTSNPTDGSRIVSNDLQVVRAALKHPQRLSAAEKLAIIRARVMMAVGPGAIKWVLEREGGRAFAREFLSDRAWLEDFWTSGSVPDPAGAFLALAEIAHNDDGWLRVPMGRHVATAMAIRYGKKDHVNMIRVYRAYEALARAGRLHKSAYSLGTRDWRLMYFASPADILFLNKLVNVPYDAHGGLFNWVSYRKRNCFGEAFYWKHRYYGPWNSSDIPSLEVKRQIGGVCVELSKFAAACAGAQGIPSWTCGQPNHLAWIWRHRNGIWWISNYIHPPTRSNVALFGGGFQGLTTMESIFADPTAHLNAEYQLNLYYLVRHLKAGAELEEQLLRSSLQALNCFVPAWHAYGRWLIENTGSRGHIHAFLRGITKGLHDARWLMWDEVDRQLEALGQRAGQEAVREEVREIISRVRESDVRVREDIDYVKVFDRLAARFKPETDAHWFELFELWLVNQWGTRNSFRAGLSRATAWAGKDKNRMEGFTKMISRIYAQKAPGKPPQLDWRGMVTQTLREEDLPAFREVVRLHDQFVPPKAPDAYPANDLGGEILSHEGMLTVSSSHGKFNAPENFARYIDRAGLTGVNPARLYTNPEKAPWATVTLPGTAEVTGIFIDNDNGKEMGSQVPLVIWTSADGKAWDEVWRTDKVEKTYRVSVNVAQAKYVRVGRAPSERVEPLRLRKILVYGKPHW